MGIQVTSLVRGGDIAAVAPRERPRESRPPLPVERNAAAAPAVENLPGTHAKQTPELRQAASSLEHISLAFNRRLKFEVDYDSKEILIKVIDNETDKVIKVLPPEELQRLHRRIKETIGFLFDEKV